MLKEWGKTTYMVLHWPKGRDTKLAQILQRQYLLPLATYKKKDLHRMAEKLMTNMFINSLMRLTEQTRLNFTVKFLSFPTLSNNSSSESLAIRYCEKRRIERQFLTCLQAFDWAVSQEQILEWPDHKESDISDN